MVQSIKALPAAIIDHPLIQYGREVCGDLAAGLRRGRVMSEDSVPALFVAAGHPAELDAQLGAVVAQLEQVSHALIDRLATLDVDTVEARIIRIEATASARFTAAEARAAEDRQAQLAAQEIAELAEESRRAAEAERDEAAETAAQAKERLGDRESRGPRG